VDWAFFFAKRTGLHTLIKNLNIGVKQSWMEFHCWTQWTQFEECADLEKKLRKLINLKGLKLVAGAGFEPATFGL
jgi:hypothetical protein